MKKVIIIAFFLTLSSVAFAVDKILLTGAIDKYQIEMELWSSEVKDKNVAGRYRYKGKQAWLDIKGHNLSGMVMEFDEFYKGESTGTFYLEQTEKTVLEGYWLNPKRNFTVKLQVKEGDLAVLSPYDLKKVSAGTSSGITGTYVLDYHFINDYWLESDEPRIEIGFNGGIVSVEELKGGELRIKFENTCGPTYHLAYFEGEATNAGKNTWVYRNKIEDFYDGPCHLVFKFLDRKLHIEQKSAGFDCGFGARAYADGEFIKVNDRVLQGENLSIEDVLQQ